MAPNFILIAISAASLLATTGLCHKGSSSPSSFANAKNKSHHRHFSSCRAIHVQNGHVHFLEMSSSSSSHGRRSKQHHENDLPPLEEKSSSSSSSSSSEGGKTTTTTTLILEVTCRRGFVLIGKHSKLKCKEIFGGGGGENGAAVSLSSALPSCKNKTLELGSRRRKSVNKKNNLKSAETFEEKRRKKMRQQIKVTAAAEERGRKKRNKKKKVQDKTLKMQKRSRRKQLQHELRKKKMLRKNGAAAATGDDKMLRDEPQLMRKGRKSQEDEYNYDESYDYDGDYDSKDYEYKDEEENHEDDGKSDKLDDRNDADDYGDYYDYDYEEEEEKKDVEEEEVEVEESGKEEDYYEEDHYEEDDYEEEYEDDNYEEEYEEDNYEEEDKEDNHEEEKEHDVEDVVVVDQKENEVDSQLLPEKDNLEKSREEDLPKNVVEYEDYKEYNEQYEEDDYEEDEYKDEEYKDEEYEDEDYEDEDYEDEDYDENYDDEYNEDNEYEEDDGEQNEDKTLVASTTTTVATTTVTTTTSSTATSTSQATITTQFSETGYNRIEQILELDHSIPHQESSGYGEEIQGVDDEDLSLGSGYSEERVHSSTHSPVTTTVATTTTTTTTTTVGPTAKSYFPTDDEDLFEGSGLDIDGEDDYSGSGFFDGGSGSHGEDETRHGYSKTTSVVQQSGSSSSAGGILSQEEKLKFREDFYHKHDIDILRLDTSCVIQFTEAPQIANATIRGYDHRVVNKVLDGEYYAEALYECNEGFSFDPPDIKVMFCSEGEWIGKRPVCSSKPSKESTRPQCSVEDAKSCEQLCFLDAAAAAASAAAPMCECYSGYNLRGDDRTCEDVDECGDDNGGCEHLCVNKPGTFMCDCRKGYQTMGTYCMDINECLLNNGHGPCQDKCRNTEGSYACSCEGLAGTTLNSDNHTCGDMNGCKSDNGGCSHQCIDSYNQIFCLCPDGFQLDPDWKTCNDIDECESMNCPHLCVNTPGSAHCECQEGFREDVIGDCVDMDECREDNFRCSHDCVNTPGGAHCLCPEGYELQGDEKNCVDKDECQDGRNGDCEQICINTDGSFECQCQAGYHKHPEDRFYCLDVNECEEVHNRCGHGDCVNTPGSHNCECHSGFVLDQGSCHDMDECSQDRDPCSELGDCVNLEGSFECNCFHGYQFTNGTCVDVDECLLGNPCVNGDCMNLAPGYDCHCHKGFQFQGGLCEDTDECEIGNSPPCGEHGHCLNTFGAYECQCPEGFEFRQGTCADINECTSSNPCGSHGDCLNTQGSYRCACHDGFEQDHPGGFCADVDECDKYSPCKNGGMCSNLEGTYECHCSTGYHLAHKDTCEDVDECQSQNGGCHHRCVNAPGSFQCQCNDGFKVDPDDERLCQDHDECQAEDNGGCSQLCLNEQGSYQCGCHPGFSVHNLDPTACLDVDECASPSRGFCEHHCVNTQGSYNCTCHPGFMRSMMDSKRCDDVDECSKDNAGCSHHCVNTEGSYKCLCPAGYKLKADSHTCKLVQQSLPCKSAPKPKNGFMRCNKKRVRGFYPVGTKCKLRCRRGYRPSAPMRKKCRADSLWSGPDSVCEPITCPTLPDVPNGRFEPESCHLGHNLRTGSVCSFKCDGGYSQTGPTSARCTKRQTWKGLESGLPSCTSDFPKPFIICPADLTKSLPGKATSVYVMFPQPKTNVDWFRYVDADPAWAKQLEGEMTRGKHVITFKARNPVSATQSASCQMIIHVKDSDPPRVRQCPQSFAEYLMPGQKTKRVTWREPIFQDNVQIQHVMASYLPGHYFTAGRHHVLYQATDADGNKARCGFTINIRPARNGNSNNNNNNYHRSSTNYRGSATPQPSNQLPSPLGSASANKGRAAGVPDKCLDVPRLRNGQMTCVDSFIGKKCIPVCDPEHQFYQKFTSRPPNYICNEKRVDWEIRKFIPDCSPIQRRSSCPAGWESRDSDLCVACPPGMYREHRDRLCQLCPKGFFSNRFSAVHCQRCTMGHTTRGLGTRDPKECYNTRPHHGKAGGGGGSMSVSSGRRHHHGSKIHNGLPKKGRLGFMFYNRWSSGSGRKGGGARTRSRQNRNETSIARPRSEASRHRKRGT